MTSKCIELHDVLSTQEARCHERQEKAVECDSECRRIQREKEEVQNPRLRVL